MKPHQYYLMVAAIIFGYYAVNFLIFYLESHYKVIRIETKDEHSNGDILKSIEINKDRFCLSEQLVEILKNTASRYLLDV